LNFTELADETDRWAGFAALADLADVQVGAATGRVGDGALGGHWELTGAKRANAPLTAAGVAAYAGVLANSTPVIGSGTKTGSVTVLLDCAPHHGVPGG